MNGMATPQDESLVLVCAQCQCYMERGSVVDLFTHRCFNPRRSSHLTATRLAIPTSHAPPSPQATGEVRPSPTNLRVFRLCEFRPPNRCWNGDLCTYAHSDEELKAWNRQAVVGKLP